jgi:hypothetical protein
MMYQLPKVVDYNVRPFVRTAEWRFYENGLQDPMKGVACILVATC